MQSHDAKKKKFKIKRDSNKKTMCYLYNKLNYFAKNCQNKKIQQQQFNIMFKNSNNEKKKTTAN